MIQTEQEAEEKKSEEEKGDDADKEEKTEEEKEAEVLISFLIRTIVINGHGEFKIICGRK